MGCVRSREAQDDDSSRQDDGYIAQPRMAPQAYPIQPQPAAYPPPYAAHQPPPYAASFPSQHVTPAYAWYPQATMVVPPQHVYYAPPPILMPPPIAPMGFGMGLGLGGFAGATMMYGSCDSLSLNSFGSIG